ncbi:uncharacterized protein LY89DRAFT_664827 [Mollisia scopiformis]|uniref:Uncharacterized protein n=1 Tax=Mollisia scopiformis TaxID=149040 RepID=A0A194XN09_MOLSC|nr:uncharacterized protein LY89DRAFT_664827 [Mollisia scopiformis]KUJ21650.1 hypothetical protein LY89DRAFT_664827 [Mollisia scopiformis]
MKSHPLNLAACFAVMFPFITTVSSLNFSSSTSSGNASTPTFSNSTSFSNTTTPSLACPDNTDVSSDLYHPFLLYAISENNISSVTLLNSDPLGSLFHISGSKDSLVDNQGVFTLHNGDLQGGLDNQPHNAGNCTILSAGFGDFVVDFPSCAVNGSGAITNGTGVGIIGTKWIARPACVNQQTAVILLPDLGPNTTTNDTYFHAIPSAPPLLFHTEQDSVDFYPVAYLVVVEAAIEDLNQPFALSAREDFEEFGFPDD